MSSINEQQTEQNHKDLSNIEAVEKLKDLAEKAKTCFFCTAMEDMTKFQTRPMTVQHVDEEGNLWFLSASDSSLNAEIESDNNVQLLFQASHHAGMVTLNGKAGISTDRKMIDALWQPLVKTWFTEGKDDPRITVIMVKPSKGYYWDNKHGNAIAFMKITLGAIIGKTLDDSIEGELSF